MTLLEKLEKFKETGWKYDPIKGQIFSNYGKLIIGKRQGYILCKLRYNNKVFGVQGHQLAWFLTYGEAILDLDHINQVKTDNSISNLRKATRQQQTFNSVQYENAKGYGWHKRIKKWLASIRVNSKPIHLGYFSNEEDARQAYLKAKELYHKETR